MLPHPVSATGPQHAFLALGIASVLALASGCATTRLRPQLAELSHFTQLTGRITGAGEGERRIALLVDEGGPLPRIVNYTIANDTGVFLLMGRAGTLRALAFADRDRDAVLDGDEPVGWVAVPSAPAGGPAARLQLGEIHLSADAPRPGFAVDLSAVGASGKQARSRRIGEIVTLDDPRFSGEIIARGVWEPLRFSEESGLQILFTEPYDPARTPVVFVHGMQGSPRDFRTLVAALDRTRFQAWLYYYPTGFDLEINGLVLRELLAELRQRLGYERLHVVAHSMGGLVSLSAITGAARDGVPLGVDRYVTLSTPWLGAAGARGMKAGLAVAPATAPAWTDMLPDSGFLAQLAVQPVPPDVHFSCFSAMRATPPWSPERTTARSRCAAWRPGRWSGKPNTSSPWPPATWRSWTMKPSSKRSTGSCAASRPRRVRPGGNRGPPDPTHPLSEPHPGGWPPRAAGLW